MKIENEFDVPAGPDETYELLIDLERIGTCVPGGEVGPAGEDGSHPVAVAVKLGPMKMNYSGTARIDERDDAGHRAVLATEVKEKRGQGKARAEMVMTVEPGPTGSRVTAVTDLDLSGRAAQMGRGVVDDVAARLVSDMADCIAKRLGAGEQPNDGSLPPVGDARPDAADFSDPVGPTSTGEVRPAGGDARPAKPIGGIRLLLQVLWGRIRQMFNRILGRK